MKETQNKQSDKIEIVKQTKAESQKVLIGKKRVLRGHKLFEVNTIDKTILLPKFESKAVNYKDAMQGNVSERKELTIKENCIYISALNKKNVVKILKRDYNIIL